MSTTNTTIRTGTKSDVPALLDLIQELAAYEKAPNEVIVTVEQLEEDGFGNNPLFHLLVAEQNDAVVGIALYYFAYSTWKGKYLYLEDLVVREALRGRGIGKLLFEAVVEIATKEKVKRMGWQVLNWNEPAINFYKTYGAELSDEWLNGRLFFEDGKRQ